MRDIPVRQFADAETLARDLGHEIADHLRQTLKTRGKVRLGVSGGRTPTDLYRVLSAIDLGWHHVHITLVDDRCVAEDSPASNLQFARTHFGEGYSNAAKLVGLWDNALGGMKNQHAAQQMLAEDGIYNGVAILGMGIDGHIASLFPGAEGMGEAMGPENGLLAKVIRAQKSAVTGDIIDRITMTLPMITGFEKLVLLIQGKEKKKVLEAALQPVSGPDALPIEELLQARPDTLIAYTEK